MIKYHTTKFLLSIKSCIKVV